jgi:hypothetical protein
MAMTKPPAPPMPTLACIGTVDMLVDRDTGAIRAQQKPKMVKNIDGDKVPAEPFAPGNVSAGVNFTATSPTGLNATHWVWFDAQQLNPAASFDQINEYAVQAFALNFIPAKSRDVALFGFLAEKKFPGVLVEETLGGLEDAYDAVTGETNAALVGKFLQDLTTDENGEKIPIGYILRQERKKDTNSGQYINTDRYVVSGFFDPERPPKSDKIQLTW